MAIVCQFLAALHLLLQLAAMHSHRWKKTSFLTIWIAKGVQILYSIVMQPGIRFLLGILNTICKRLYLIMCCLEIHDGHYIFGVLPLYMECTLEYHEVGLIVGGNFISNLVYIIVCSSLWKYSPLYDSITAVIVTGLGPAVTVPRLSVLHQNQLRQAQILNVTPKLTLLCNIYRTRKHYLPRYQNTEKCWKARP